MAAAVHSALQAVVASLQAGAADAARAGLPRLRAAVGAADAAGFPSGSLQELAAIVQAGGAGALAQVALDSVFLMLQGPGPAAARDVIATEGLARCGAHAHAHWPCPFDRRMAPVDPQCKAPLMHRCSPCTVPSATTHASLTTSESEVNDSDAMA